MGVTSLCAATPADLALPVTWTRTSAAASVQPAELQQSFAAIHGPASQRHAHKLLRSEQRGEHRDCGHGADERQRSEVRPAEHREEPARFRRLRFAGAAECVPAEGVPVHLGAGPRSECGPDHGHAPARGGLPDGHAERADLPLPPHRAAQPQAAAARHDLLHDLADLPDVRGLYIVGSSLNGFGNANSDMDLGLMITNKDPDQRTDAVVVLSSNKRALQDVKFITRMQMILATVSILRMKFTSPFDDIVMDLNANNSVAIRNTHLLCYYSSSF